MFDGIQPDPVAFTIPIGDGFPIYWYGILVTLGIALGAWWGATEVRKRGLNVDEFFNGLIIVIISGYIFARLGYVLLEVFAGRGDQFDSFLSVINIRQGGINILAGFVGAAVVAWIYLTWRRLPFWDYADVAGPALLLAQGIGRWGNWVNQELYGPPTTLAWGVLIDAQHRLPAYSDLSQFPLTTRFHPTWLYESIWLLLGFVVLVLLNRRFRSEWRAGTLFGLFLMWWGAGRALLEFLRPDQPTIGGSPITYSMVVSVLLAAAGLWIFLHRYNKSPLSRRRRLVKPKPQRRAP
jgi:phosphatidylglycerol:prolipoprotein diacylglycerol transferase